MLTQESERRKLRIKCAGCLGAGGSCLNPSYSGGRDEEDHGSKPARANSS
jgi:hypothetical protein